VEVQATGFHEVVIESPQHNAVTALQPPAAIKRILYAWRTRGRALQDQQSSLQHILYFKNNGSVAGASLVHPHSQIVGLPIVPREPQIKHAANLEWFTSTGVSVFQRQVEEEMAARDAHEAALSSSSSSSSLVGHRIVEQNDAFIAYVPFAAISPFHLYIVPLSDSAHFEEASDDMIEAC
jgi:UDPglucose--hexose-1-phosphate uridylyltransferase